MRRIRQLWILSLITLGQAVAKEPLACNWCVVSDSQVTLKALALAKLKPTEMLKSVESEGICVKILKTNRRIPKGLFHWGQIRKAEGNLEQFTTSGVLMGKTLCPGELPIAKGCKTILLAADAPRSTLIHEYLHVKQIEKDASWCPISKRAWAEGKLPRAEYQRALNQEWDVHVWLWKHIEQMNLSAEDKVGIASNLLEQAEKRKDFDAEASKYVKNQRVQDSLLGFIDAYKKQLGLEGSKN